jgi:hypothetical protein
VAGLGGVAEDAVEVADGSRCVEFGEQGLVGGEAHAAGDDRLVVGVAGQVVGLGVVQVLQAVLDPAQEVVGGGQLRSASRVMMPRSARRPSTLRVGLICSEVSRPPRMSWKTWARNSISRMPPGPSLTLWAMSLRATSRRIWACRSRMALMAPKSRYLRKMKGRAMAVSSALRMPVITRALIQA